MLRGVGGTTNTRMTTPMTILLIIRRIRIRIRRQGSTYPDTIYIETTRDGEFVYGCWRDLLSSALGPCWLRDDSSDLKGGVRLSRCVKEEVERPGRHLRRS